MERKLLFKALVGSHNYNLNTEESDKDYKVFVLPTFEDLYKGEMYSAQTVGKLEDLDIHDARKLSNLFFKANINFLEVLFSKEIVYGKDLSFKQKTLINKLFILKNEIVKMNLPYLYNACFGMYLNKVNNLTKGTEGTQHLVESYGYDTKQGQHAFRVSDFLKRFELTGFNDFESAMRYDNQPSKHFHGRHDLLFLKEGGFELEEFVRMMDNYIKTEINPLKEKYYAFEPNLKLKDEIDLIIMELVKESIQISR